jgi:hypothetical protein
MGQYEVLEILRKGKWVSVADISKMTGVSKDSVNKAIARILKYDKRKIVKIKHARKVIKYHENINFKTNGVATIRERFFKI